MNVDIKHTLTRLFKHAPESLKGGVELMFYCSICNHYKKKLSINTQTGEWRCWVCNIGGRSFKSLLKKYKAPPEYFTLLCDSNDTDHQHKIEVVHVPVEFPPEYKPLYVNNTDPLYKHALLYCKKRNILLEDIYRYNIGYCSSGDYANRIIIPSYDMDNKLNFLVGRTFYGESTLKYKTCKNSSKNIIGFESFINFDEEITLVEGVFDAISVRYNAIPLFGKTISNKLKDKLLEKKPPRVNVLLDRDAHKDALLICDFLVSNFITCNLVMLESNKDPNEMTLKEIWNDINKNNIVTDVELYKEKIKNNLLSLTI